MFKRSILSLLVFLLLAINFSQANADVYSARQSIYDSIDSGKVTISKEHVASLSSDYANDPNLPKVLLDIANRYCYRGRINDAKYYYNLLKDNFSQSDYAYKARLNVARMDIYTQLNSGQFSQAEASINNLIASNSGDTDYLPVMLYYISNVYLSRGMYDKSDQLYNRIIQLTPADHKYSRYSKIQLKKSDIFIKIDSGDTAGVRALTEELISPDPKAAVSTLYAIAGQYVNRSIPDEARQLYQRIVSIDPNGSIAKKKVPLDLVKLDIFSEIDKGNISTAQSQTSNLISSYSSNSYLPSYLYAVACRLSSRGYLTEAKQLYSSIVAEDKSAHESGGSEMQLLRLDICESIDMGDLDTADSKLESMISNKMECTHLLSMLYSIAEKYTSYGKSDRARQIYNRMLAMAPDNSISLRSSIAIAELEIRKSIDASDWDSVFSQTDALIANYRENYDLPYTLSAICGNCSSRSYEKSRLLYDKLTSIWTDHIAVKRVPLDLAKLDIWASIDSGDISVAQSKIADLISTYKDHFYLPVYLYSIAGRLSYRGYTDEAIGLYSSIVTTYKADYQSSCAEMQILRLNICKLIDAGDLNTASSMIENMLSAKSGHYELPEVLYSIAGRYAACDEDVRAMEIYNRIIAMTSESRILGKTQLAVSRLQIQKNIDSCNWTQASALTGQLISDHGGHVDLPGVLSGIANYYKDSFNHDRAKQVYTSLINLAPEHYLSNRAKIEIEALDARSELAMGAYDSFRDKIANLRNTYGQYESLTNEIYQLGYDCLGMHNYSEAMKVLELVPQQDPSSDYGERAASMCYDTAAICKDIEEGNLAEAQTGITKFKADYPKHEFLSNRLYFIAFVYARYHYFDQARDLCDEIISNYDDKFAEFSKIKKACINISSCLDANDINGAKQVVSQFKSDFANSRHLQTGLLCLAEEFSNKGLGTIDKAIASESLNIAIKICEDPIVSNDPSHDLRAQVYSILGYSYLSLNNFDKSVEYFQRLVNESPDSKYSSNAQFMIGKTYENMLVIGKTSEPEVKPQIVDAYQKVLLNYSHCKVANSARKWLNNSN